MSQVRDLIWSELWLCVHIVVENLIKAPHTKPQIFNMAKKQQT